MRSLELTKRNLREVWRDPLSLGLTVGLPIVLLLVLQLLESVEEFFSATFLVPGIALFGFVMLMFSSAMILSRDRESALFSRLLTAPLRSNDFVAGYTLPYVPVAIVQALVLFGIAAVLGLTFEGNVGLVVLIMLIMAIFYIGLGMIAGALFTVRQVPFIYSAILILTIFGGAWMDLDAIGGPIQTIGDALPFAHALDASRSVMVDGAGFSAIAGDLTWVVGYTLVTVILALVAFRRRMLE